MPEEGWSYARAGVDIDAGNKAVERIKRHVAATARPGVLGGIGGFAGLFQLEWGRFRDPVLVAGCDGVGTKLKVAFALGRHDTVGIDAVAMCVNDILVQGAEPLFFLDYLAVGRLEPAQVEQVVAGVAAGCRAAGCALLGGETAEMPGFYPPGEYDLAGFAVGVAEKAALVDGSAIRPGDVVLGLASAGLHSNGFSLARRVLLEEAGLSLRDRLPALGCTLGEELLRPTRIYVRPVRELMRQVKVKGMAHITGGGLLENIPRVLPPGTRVRLAAGSWPVPPIFQLLRTKGNVPEPEMLRTFNVGIGYVLIVAREDKEEALEVLTAAGEKAMVIGAVTAGEPGVEVEGRVFP
ncbi:phosphoribosylformylglycinamidine cyclo-ligase [Gelria sp. Kuro-4]|uniref:phosphoribosylformylglycinamidine cyclo-ligase n=1 Tax=Gelria sp. Kuro-4 TaxID=2796927 RepID=UPI001BEEB17F|nr:phosphoribosylformylglycinamidine cyclo-ligase [Gelria sp. Kuro-4]BCV24468.1 phosphoribosylformylglycinamidine cyclo-ligase [Gelria sp. Kuro-4]